jgi:hypothetical protein
MTAQEEKKYYSEIRRRLEAMYSLKKATKESIKLIIHGGLKVHSQLGHHQETWR